jgi:predicted NUDIX family phosphoesterase
MNKDNQLIMVVKREKLFNDNHFQGFSLAERVDFKERVLSNFQYLSRKEVETDNNYKQPISYVIFFNRENKTIFAYQRAEKEEDSKEKRLHGKWSLGIGGHIDKEEDEKDDPIEESVLKEIEEEVEAKIKEIELVGYINDDSNSVGEVHFGFLYLAETEENVFPRGREIKDSKMITIEEILDMENHCEIESWSKIVLPFLKDILEKKDA